MLTILAVFKCAVQWHFLHSRCCTTRTTIYKTLSSPPRDPCTHRAVIPYFPLLTVTANLLYIRSISINVPILDILYKRNQAIFVLSCLAHFT